MRPLRGGPAKAAERTRVSAAARRAGLGGGSGKRRQGCGGAKTGAAVDAMAAVEPAIGSFEVTFFFLEAGFFFGRRGEAGSHSLSVVVISSCGQGKSNDVD